VVPWPGPGADKASASPQSVDATAIVRVDARMKAPSLMGS
jgi:hypothetical protein